MSGSGQAWGIGIEEEYLLVDAEGDGLRQDSQTVRAVMQSRHSEEIDPELLQSQVEVATGVHATIDGAREELLGLRARVGDAAHSAGCRLVAAGTHPTARWADQLVTDKARYHGLEAGMGQVARETVVCGLHVHVGIPDHEDRIKALNGARRWLGPLLALSASSPYWEGKDTGFSSYRTPVFRRWPMTGVPQPFVDWAEFDGLLDSLVTAGVVDDGTNLYWDLRPSVRFPTVEVRVADACPRLDDTLTLAALIRGVLRTAIDTAGDGPDGSDGSAPPLRTELLEAAVRHASKHGLGSTLVHPMTGRQAPAEEVVDALVSWCRPALEAVGDAALVAGGVARIVASGGAAARIRAARRSEGWPGVTAMLVEETSGTP